MQCGACILFKTQLEADAKQASADRADECCNVGWHECVDCSNTFCLGTLSVDVGGSKSILLASFYLFIMLLCISFVFHLKWLGCHSVDAEGCMHSELHVWRRQPAYCLSCFRCLVRLYEASDGSSQEQNVVAVVLTRVCLFLLVRLFVASALAKPQQADLCFQSGLAGRSDAKPPPRSRRLISLICLCCVCGPS